MVSRRGRGRKGMQNLSYYIIEEIPTRSVVAIFQGATICYDILHVWQSPIALVV